MKQILLGIFLGFALQASAQAPFNDMDSIDANNINAVTLVHGDMWYHPNTYVAHCNYPSGSHKNVGFASAIWMSGYDATGALHMAAQTYRQDGNDYWPGPLDAADTLDYATSRKWSKVWKVKRTEINSFIALSSHDETNTPQSILTWPGKGSAYAKGKDGDALSVTTDMAPFVDLNGNGIYEPLSGEYPFFNGEQALWWVFSDNGPSHFQTHSLPLKVEVHGMAYAFKRNTIIDNVVYYDYTIINKSANNYNDFRLALWSDVDLGYFMDDFIGFDSTHRMGITYNAGNDDGAAAGGPDNSYGLNPPISAVTMVQLPGDVGTSFQPVGSFMYYNNDMSAIGNPVVDTEFNFYLRSKWRFGTHLTNTFTAAGVPNTGFGAGPECNYVFGSDPTTPGGWDECTSGNNPGDRRFIIATNSFTLAAGSQQKVVMALVVDSAGGGCPSMNLAGIKEVADTAWAVFHGLPTGVNDKPNVMRNAVQVYPNPAHDQLTIDCSQLHEDIQVRICNVLGQCMGSSFCKRAAKNTVDISSYPSGMYIVSYTHNGVEARSMFMKD